MGVELPAGRRPKGQSRSVPVDGWTKKKTPRGAEPNFKLILIITKIISICCRVPVQMETVPETAFLAGFTVVSIPIPFYVVDKIHVVAAAE